MSANLDMSCMVVCGDGTWTCDGGNGDSGDDDDDDDHNDHVYLQYIVTYLQQWRFEMEGL